MLRAAARRGQRSQGPCPGPAGKQQREVACPPSAAGGRRRSESSSRGRSACPSSRRPLGSRDEQLAPPARRRLSLPGLRGPMRSSAYPPHRAALAADKHLHATELPGREAAPAPAHAKVRSLWTSSCSALSVLKLPPLVPRQPPGSDGCQPLLSSATAPCRVWWWLRCLVFGRKQNCNA